MRRAWRTRSWSVASSRLTRVSSTRSSAAVKVPDRSRGRLIATMATRLKDLVDLGAVAPMGAFAPASAGALAYADRVDVGTNGGQASA
jgi:hypothetical protein